MTKRILLSTIGSRGDVQPLVALALQLKELGQDVRLCVPPDFRDWIEGLGFPVTPIGPELRTLTAARPQATPFIPTPEQRRQMVEGTVATQFETIGAAAEGCNIIVGATALQVAARSVAEMMGIPYVFVAYCPAVLPSRHHAPPPLAARGDSPTAATVDHEALWTRDAERFNDTFGAALNAQRVSAGLAPVSEVRRHIFTDQPWLAADQALAPWPEPGDGEVVQTGAWIVQDSAPLSAELTAFLDAGEAPIYFGFGSMRAPEGVSHVMINAARALGRRALISRGWADLSLVDDAADVLAIGDVNQQTLFPRVAAVVHHGGAGTTTAAARAGAPQVIIPQIYDQHYFAHRIQHLEIGTAHDGGTPTVDSLTRDLERTLHPEMSLRARRFARSVRSDGALLAAKRLIALDPMNRTVRDNA